jgi:hypothetical protein
MKMTLESKLEKTEKQVMEEAESMDSVGRILSKVESVGLQGLGGAESMRQKLEEYDKIREVILDYIERNLVKDIDFGWTDERSKDKSTLKKPGAEKVCRMFNTHPRWVRDYDMWEMAGKPTGTIFLMCQIVDNDTGKVIGEGRGAAKIGEKARDANKTIKNAEKCSLVDAALYTFMLSEKFTQDDGGKQKSVIDDHKTELMADVELLRAGTPSELSDLSWIHTVVKNELHISRLQTIGQVIHMRKALFEEKRYDLSTGEMIPQEGNNNGN